MSKTNANGSAKTAPAFDPAALFQGFAMPNFAMPDFAMPTVDMDAFVASQARNVEALTEANKLASDGMQALATRQSEIMKSAADAYADAFRGLMGINDPQASLAKQAEIAKTSFKTSNANVRELAGIAVKAQTKSLDVINKRVVESMDELQALAAKV